MDITYYLVLQRHDRIILGGVDVENMEAVLSAQVICNVGEGGAGSLGHTVIDDNQILNLRQCRRVPQAVPYLSLLHLSHLVSGHGALCRRKDMIIFTSANMHFIFYFA